MDSASWTLLRRVVEAVPSAAIVLTTSLMQIHRGVAELSVDTRRLMRSMLATHVRLKELSTEDVHQLLCLHLRVARVQKEVVEHITTRTSGNALYSIELVKMMVERQVLLSTHSICKCMRRALSSTH